MDEIFVELTRTKARQEFKKRVGTTTQHLLTLVVGLSAVEAGAKAPSTLPARWDPQSPVDAARRARTFANQATLLWTVESLVGYVSDLRRAKPPVIAGALSEQIGSIKDKQEKLVHLAAEMGITDSYELNLVRAAYVWRNRVTHIGARNELNGKVAAALERDAVEIRALYQGLDVFQVIKRIDGNEPPRLKEATAIVRAAGNLVRELDERIVRQLDQEMYLSGLLAEHVLSPETRQARMQRAVGLWGGTPKANARSITTLALQYGLSPSDDMCAGPELSRLNPTQALDFLDRRPDSGSGALSSRRSG